MSINGTKISEMTELENIQGGEYIPIVDSEGYNKKVKTDVFAKEKELDSLDIKISSTKKNISFGKNLFNKETVTKGYFLTPIGNIVQYDSFYISAYIPIRMQY